MTMTDKLDTKAIRAQMDALAGFTAGPWNADLGETYRVKADGMNIATANFVTLLDRIPTDQVGQNVRLIAAAPDMHEAILALCDALDELRAENERLKRLLDLQGTGPAERYWEGRWRGEAADNERLRAALQPFSEEAGYWISHNYSREDRPVEGFKGYTSVMTCGDLFNAHAALAQKGGE